MEISLRHVANMLNEAERIVITAHIHPDGDSLGSMLALYASLAAQGKKVWLLLDDEVPAVYRFLPGAELIRRPEGKMEADLLVVLDASDADRVTAVVEAVRAKTLNIDHHISNTKFTDYWYIDSQAAATGEIILDLLHLMKLEITADIAVNLFTAIATDCGFFRYANASSATLRHAADLIDRGARPHVIAEQLETKPLASIMTLRGVLDSLEIHAGGRIATVTVYVDAAENAAETTEGYINYPRNIEGVELAVLFKPVDDNATRVSFRSRRLDVARLALGFGGGGHARAAGCTVASGLAGAKEQILRAAERLLAESGL
ncbi:DHH family phosphoesterase [Anaeroselena agilis]|uniref:DHH family phosphoesterase n=1 Tax=Anaeroselena agilis TaxID=3063788 RepID=A0ABU3NZS3_9FIRM|nr:DHH family phosphoesterase [Selenomonadales bacterium 4137-cl]